jgi:single-stranded-DNA-specific exonuclease
MGHAITAYNLLTASDDEVAKPLIAELDKHNKNRQGLVSDVVKHAIDQISELDAQKKVIVVFSEKCTAGIAGIVASKIIDKYSRPVLVVGKGESGFVGSGRSVDGFHITNIINQLNIETQNSLFLRCGGHAKACGFTLNSIEDIGILREKINNIADTVLADFTFDKQINIDAVINLDDVDLRLYKELRKFEPHGMSNPKPKFLSKGVIISVLSQVGIGNKHLRLLVNSSETNQKRYKCIGFGLGQIADSLAVGGQADIVFEIDIDEWNGYTDIQLVLCDIRPAS